MHFEMTTQTKRVAAIGSFVSTITRERCKKSICQLKACMKLVFFIHLLYFIALECQTILYSMV